MRQGARIAFGSREFYLQHSGEQPKSRSVSNLAAVFPGLDRARIGSMPGNHGYDLARLARELDAQMIGNVTVEDLERFMASVGRAIAGAFRPASDWRRNRSDGGSRQVTTK